MLGTKFQAGWLAPAAAAVLTPTPPRRPRQKGSVQGSVQGSVKAVRTANTHSFRRVRQGVTAFHWPFTGRSIIKFPLAFHWPFTGLPLAFQWPCKGQLAPLALDSSRLSFPTREAFPYSCAGQHQQRHVKRPYLLAIARAVLADLLGLPDVPHRHLRRCGQPERRPLCGDVLRARGAVEQAHRQPAKRPAICYESSKIERCRIGANHCTPLQRRLNHLCPERRETQTSMLPGCTASAHHCAAGLGTMLPTPSSSRMLPLSLAAHLATATANGAVFSHEGSGNTQGKGGILSDECSGNTGQRRCSERRMQWEHRAKAVF